MKCGYKKLQEVITIAKYFRTRSPISAADIDGWRARELMAPLFMGDDEEFHSLIRVHLILPYLFGDFHPSHLQEYAGGLLLALQKPGGGLRPILCGESWRRCFASLAAHAVRAPVSNIFTSTYNNFMQTAGLRDGASHCAKILSSMYDSLNSDPNDPDVLVKLDIKNAFNMLCRQLTLDVLGGKASCDYACGLKEGDSFETTCEELRNMFAYFKAMRTTKSHLRYFDYLGNVLEAWGKTGGQQGDPLEMIVFCISIHHLWGRTLAKYQQHACAIAYADDGYIKAKLSVALKVLSDIQQVFKEDAGLELQLDKTAFLVKGISAEDALHAADTIVKADPSLSHLASDLLHIQRFTAEGYEGLGVPLGTDAFVQNFVKDKCLAIIDDVDKLDSVDDGFIHYQLLRFCQATRLQYLNGQISIRNQNSLQQQHVDRKIADALLKKGTKGAYTSWTQQDRAWVDMVLHLPHEQGGFGVTNNTVSRHAALYASTARFVAFLGTFPRDAQQVWLPGNTLDDPSTWVAPPLRMLQHLHEVLVQDYECTDQPAAAQLSQPPGPAGGAAAGAGAGQPPQPAGSQDQQDGKLILPQLNRLHEVYKRNQVASPASDSSQDQQPAKPTIPSQKRVTQQLTTHWPLFKALRQTFANTRAAQQLQLHQPQKVKATDQDSALRVEMSALEDQADNGKARELHWKPMSWLGTLRPTTVDDAWAPAIWQTFFTSTLGLEVPVLSSLPRQNNLPAAKCGCKKFLLDTHGDHISTCTAHSGATKAHDWMVGRLGPLFRTAGHRVRTQHGVSTSAENRQKRGDVEILNYLQDAAGSRNLVFDLSVTHDRYGSSAQPHHNGLLTHPQDLDAPLHVAARKKISTYRDQYANNRNITFMPAITSTSSRMHGEFLRLLFLQAHRETTAHFTAIGMPAQQHCDSFRFRRAAFYNGLKSKVGLAAAKTAAMRINLNIDGCGVVAPPVHSSLRAPHLLANLLAHNLPLPRAAH